MRGVAALCRQPAGAPACIMTRHQRRQLEQLVQTPKIIDNLRSAAASRCGRDLSRLVGDDLRPDSFAQSKNYNSADQPAASARMRPPLRSLLAARW